MSDIDSDFEQNDPFKIPTVQDQLIDLQHFLCDLTRKIGTLEDKVLENKYEIYRLQVKLNQHQTSYTKITAILIYIITMILLLTILKYV